MNTVFSQIQVIPSEREGIHDICIYSKITTLVYDQHEMRLLTVSVELIFNQW